MPRRPLLLAVAAILVTGCGVPDADRERAEVLAATCLSTIVRNGLPEPSAAQISPERFSAERQRLLATGRRFNTVTPYRNICNAIRRELSDATSVPPASTPDSTILAGDTPDNATPAPDTGS